MQNIGIDVHDAELQAVYSSRAPFDEHRVGAAAVYCSDGRFGEQMDEFLHEGLGLPRYDRVAMPGGAACLAGHTIAFHDQYALERQLGFLITQHALTRVVLIAHEGCGFYRDVWLGLRTMEQQQRLDLDRAAKLIAETSPGVEVECYFARKVKGLVVFERWTANDPHALSSRL